MFQFFLTNYNLLVLIKLKYIYRQIVIRITLIHRLFDSEAMKYFFTPHYNIRTFLVFNLEHLSWTCALKDWTQCVIFFNVGVQCETLMLITEHIVFEIGTRPDASGVRNICSVLGQWYCFLFFSFWEWWVTFIVH